MVRPSKVYKINASSSILREYLKIGFIQVVIDGRMAWLNPIPSFKMNRIVELKLCREIKKGFNKLKHDTYHPNIIVLPELSVPNGYLPQLLSLSKAISAIVIAGLDFSTFNDRVKNRAVVIVPQNWPDRSIKSKRVSIIYFGKTFLSVPEKNLFAAINGINQSINYKFIPDPTMYIFDAGQFGKIGVAICSDFYDIERFIIYRGRIHHMIVIANNRDTNSFYFLSEAISRLVFCNVIVCNTGQYGDSLAFTPYRKSYKRIKYRHEGNELYTTQVVNLPVFQLDEAQRGNDTNNLFKSLPPGYLKI